MKARDYGAVFLELIQDYCQKHAIVENMPGPATKSPKKVVNKNDNEPSSGRQLSVARDFNAGSNLEQLAEQYDVTIGTIINHLVKYSSEGNALRGADDLLNSLQVTPLLQAEVFTAFDEEGTELLKPVFTRMNESVSYDDLKILRLIYMTKSNR